MNYRMDVVNFFFGGHLFLKSYFLEERSLERGIYQRVDALYIIYGREKLYHCDQI